MRASLTLGELVLPKLDDKILSLALNVILVLSFAVITAVAAQIKVEIGIVPITLQTFAVLLSGILLGSRRGAAAQAGYLFGGLAGIPWFSRGGGLIYLLSPTFGYILGFVAAAYVTGFLAEHGWDRRMATAGLAMLIGSMVIYCCGVLWLSRFIPAQNILAVGVYPFLLGDTMKICLAAALLPGVWKLIDKQ